MPQLRKLNQTESQRLERSDPAARRRIVAEYDAILAQFAVGEYGHATPAPNETSLAVRRRLDAAARRRGWELRWLPGGDLIFQIQADS